MKKLKTTLLAALAIFAFTACGAKENDGAKKEEAAPANEQTEQKDDSKEEDSSADNSDKKFAGKTLTLAGLDGGYGTEGWKKVIANFEEMTGAKVEASSKKISMKL